MGSNSGILLVIFTFHSTMKTDEIVEIRGTNHKCDSEIFVLFSFSYTLNILVLNVLSSKCKIIFSSSKIIQSHCTQNNLSF